ncbi:cell division transport system permease protein [Pullulanibacillus pueri]|uniref:Cell division protein FtsX n=1 Tax=Pullulanibacillus pueri TaxID=1437324 RepID=A0A8J3A0I8_9BACL|nr:permease-like cell division protein FtsX [Pullulanibacillus pueri]MBM7684186.1 cell division transport system permease protein [Pullulanibacillus pueri]GGH88903.1 cell division protein FtsX [Pullulanibacillus pueri]
MKARTIGRHLKESIKNLGRNGWMTVASISAVAVALMIVGLFLMVMLNLNKMAGQIENDVEVRAYIDLTATPQQQDELKEQIKQISEVHSIKYISREEGLKELMKDFGKDADVIKPYQGDDNPLNDAFEIKTQKPKQTEAVAKKIEKLKYVSDVSYGKGYVKKLFNVVDVARNVGIILILGLLFTSIFLIANTIKLTIVARSTEIEIMKLVGATNAFVRWPYFLEGLFLGVIGACIPVALLLIIYRQLYTYFIQNNFQSYAFIKLIPFDTMALYLAGLLIIIGAVIGVWGSLTSVRRFLKV